MSVFRTVVEFEKPGFTISHEDSICMIGSCFSDNIGKKLHQYGFNVLNNPFGVVYNPVSVLNTIALLSGEIDIKNEDLIETSLGWTSFYHHSSFCSESREEFLRKSKEKINAGKEQLEKSKIIIITLGTAVIYEYLQTGKIVSNCHKVSSKNFKYRLLLVNEIESALEEIIKKFPDKKVVFTISPVRHLKNGAFENHVSKSLLAVAIHNLLLRYPGSYYFPSFEIFVDELRDYRFYADDMIHPSTTGVDYVWERFTETFFDKKTMQLIGEIEKIKKAYEHRAFNVASAKHKSFLENQLHQINRITSNNPTVNLSEYKLYFESGFKKE